MISNNMFNQDIKPLLPSLSYPQNIMPIKPIGTSLATASTVSATTGITGGANNSQGGNLHYNSTPAPISSSSSVSNTPIINNHSNGIQHNNSNQSNLPPLQFYSSKDYYDDILHQPLQLNQINQINQLPTGQIHQFLINQNHQFHPQIVPQLQPTPQTNHLHINTSYFDPKFEKDDDKFSIDYSSIINYTNSPSLKRKKRTRSGQSPNDINNNSINSIILNDDNKLPCQICGKMFAKPYNLKSHMKSHSSEKPFKCSLCPKTFARSHDKKRHELLHNGEKNFKCEGMLKDGKTKWGCGKRFARSDALSRHFRTETGWLCIKPLMDEAKIMESNDLFGNYTHS